MYDPWQEAKMVSEVPSQIPRGADIPNRQEPPNLPGVLRQITKDSGREELQGLGKDGFQDPVHVLKITMFRARLPRNQVQFSVGLQQRQGEIVIDVRVHSSQGKLDALNARTKTRLEQCLPRTGDVCGVAQPIQNCSEIKLGKDDV